MANLRIYSDIVGEETKAFLQWQGVDSIAFSDVEAFVAGIPAEDEAINLVINCRGGSTRDALAMYDALRASGKTISAEVTGQCSSSATILLCAARKDLRKARPNCTLLIHNPYVAGYVEGDASEMRKVAEQLDEERKRFLDIYVERTGADREVLSAMMDNDAPMSVDKAIELGFINEKIIPISAKDKMSKSIKSAFVALGKALGVTMVGLDVELADGSILTLKKEDGEPLVGDGVENADGEYLLPTGETIIVTDGKIAEIKPAEKEDELVTETTEEVAEEAEVEPQAEEAEAEPEATEEEENEKDAKIAELEAIIADKDAVIADLEKKLAEAEGNAKTDEESEILNAVAVAGGKEWLATAKSTEKVSASNFEKPATQAKAQSYLEYYKAKYNK